MKSFREYVRDGKVKTGQTSSAEADSLRKQAVNRFEQEIQNVEINDKNATFKFEGAYEVLRQLLQSFMAEEGYKPYSHEAIIAYSKENGLISEKEADELDRYRRLRNDIRYRGETTNLKRAKRIVELAETKLKELVNY